MVRRRVVLNESHVLQNLTASERMVSGCILVTLNLRAAMYFSELTAGSFLSNESLSQGLEMTSVAIITI